MARIAPDALSTIATTLFRDKIQQLRS